MKTSIQEVTEDEEDEESLGNWMIQFELEERVRCFIACEELGYPYSEALYGTVTEWEKATGKDWYSYVADIA